MYNPLVSIIIPVFNGSDFLEEAIKSALDQTYKKIEIIVINDGSCDNGKTESVAFKYKDQINYIVKENGGVSSAFNLGIKNMKGTYFSWLSHDDVYLPNKIADQIAYLISNDFINKEIILYSDYDLIDENSILLKHYKISHTQPEYFKWLILTSYPVNGNTVLIPKSCFEKVGLFNEEFKTQQDYDMWVRLATYFPFIHLQKPLIKSRIHMKQGTITMSELMKKNTSDFYISYIKSISPNELLKLSSQTDISKVYSMLAINHSRRKNILVAKYCCKIFKNTDLTFYSYYFLIFRCRIIYSYKQVRTFTKNIIVNLLPSSKNIFN